MKNAIIGFSIVAVIVSGLYYLGQSQPPQKQAMNDMVVDRSIIQRESNTSNNTTDTTNQVKVPEVVVSETVETEQIATQPIYENGIWKWTYTTHGYRAQASFKKSIATDVKTHIRGYERDTKMAFDGVMVVATDDGGKVLRFDISAAEAQYCHFGYCSQATASVYTTDHHEWEYLGFITASDMGVPTDSLVAHHVYSMKIDGVIVYAESDIAVHQNPTEELSALFDSFLLQVEMKT